MFDDAYHGEAESEEDCAQEMVEDNGLLNEVPESLRSYFYFEAWVRELSARAKTRAGCAVSARPLRGSGFPSRAVATSTAGLQHPFRMRRPFYAPYPALSAPRQTDTGL